MPETFFNKVAGLRPATLLKMRLWHLCFPVNFAKFLITPFLQNISGRLLICRITLEHIKPLFWEWPLAIAIIPYRSKIFLKLLKFSKI